MTKKEFESWKQINSKRIYINKAKINDIELKLENFENKVIPIKNSEEKNINIEINAIYRFNAPVYEGTKIGNLTVKNKNEIIEIVDIICGKTIEKRGVYSYFKELISVLPSYKFFK